MLYWLMKRVFLGPLLHLFFRPKIEGTENIPDQGGAILASNHLAVADSFFLPLKVRRRVTFPAKLEYFTQPGIKGKLKKWFFTGMGQIPIDRSGGAAAQAALDTGIRLLREGHLLGIYPEGTRSPDGRLYKGHTGVARLALRNRVPVFAVACIGTREAQPIGRAVPRVFMPITIRISRPLDFSRYYDRADDPQVLRSVTDEIMWELRELSGQEYVHHYAKRRDDVGMAAEPTRVAAAAAVAG